jgi:hypothetical protein
LLARRDSGASYFAEQLGFRKGIDATSMIAAMINGGPDPDVRNTPVPCVAQRAIESRALLRAL